MSVFDVIMLLPAFAKRASQSVIYDQNYIHGVSASVTLIDAM
jgi:hypothetical protein